MIKTWYEDDELIPLSGIQHFHYCRRQWALIHVERQWVDNLRTTEGQYVHRNVDDPFFNESRGSVISTRSLPLVSHQLGFQGIADVVEFTPSNKGICLPGRDGLWQAKPVEYKRGKQKIDERDEVQLCAQAMCLEEMFNTHIENADLFYHETRRRVHVTLSNELRELVFSLSEEMHELIRKGITPSAKGGKHCSSCSLYDICIPSITKKRTLVSKYITKHIQEASRDDI